MQSTFWIQENKDERSFERENHRSKIIDAAFYTDSQSPYDGARTSLTCCILLSGSRSRVRSFNHYGICFLWWGGCWWHSDTRIACNTGIPGSNPGRQTGIRSVLKPQDTPPGMRGEPVPGLLPKVSVFIVKQIQLYASAIIPHLSMITQ